MLLPPSFPSKVSLQKIQITNQSETKTMNFQVNIDELFIDTIIQKHFSTFFYFPSEPVLTASNTHHQSKSTLKKNKTESFLSEYLVLDATPLTLPDIKQVSASISVPGFDSFTVTLSISKDIFTTPLLLHFQPLILRIISIDNMPQTPISLFELEKTYGPVFCTVTIPYQSGEKVFYTCPKSHTENYRINTYFIISPRITTEVVVELHDRDTVVPEPPFYSGSGLILPYEIPKPPFLSINPNDIIYANKPRYSPTGITKINLFPIGKGGKIIQPKNGNDLLVPIANFFENQTELRYQIFDISSHVNVEAPSPVPSASQIKVSPQPVRRRIGSVRSRENIVVDFSEPSTSRFHRWIAYTKPKPVPANNKDNSKTSLLNNDHNQLSYNNNNTKNRNENSKNSIRINNSIILSKDKEKKGNIRNPRYSPSNQSKLIFKKNKEKIDKDFFADLDLSFLQKYENKNKDETGIIQTPSPPFVRILQTITKHHKLVLRENNDTVVKTYDYNGAIQKTNDLITGFYFRTPEEEILIVETRVGSLADNILNDCFVENQNSLSSLVLLWDSNLTFGYPRFYQHFNTLIKEVDFPLKMYDLVRLKGLYFHNTPNSFLFPSVQKLNGIYLCTTLNQVLETDMFPTPDDMIQILTKGLLIEAEKEQEIRLNQLSESSHGTSQESPRNPKSQRSQKSQMSMKSTMLRSIKSSPIDDNVITQEGNNVKSKDPPKKRTLSRATKIRLEELKEDVLQFYEAEYGNEAQQKIEQLNLSIIDPQHTESGQNSPSPTSRTSKTLRPSFYLYSHQTKNKIIYPHDRISCADNDEQLWLVQDPSSLKEKGWIIEEIKTPRAGKVPSHIVMSSRSCKPPKRPEIIQKSAFITHV